ncbi:MAG TPA: helix-hairpin-helix domain-containing protein, partial [Candidatus Lokiarchaeia archaeon]|nr:helix-hairpin-helix domain-containing protein [Candidatus Lokiarchaeia archaeon]
TDAELLTRVDWAYHEVRLRRAYYSAFAPLKGTPLENHPATPPARERRLYMADFLLRQYKVPITDMRGIYTDQGFLPPGDPKVHLARAFFAPGEKLEVNEADFDLLIRVPGIGLKTARRILELRDRHQLIKKPKQLQLLGAVLPKALPFLTISGTGQSTLDQFLVRNIAIRK